jgi:hypothetical protein
MTTPSGAQVTAALAWFDAWTAAKVAQVPFFERSTVQAALASYRVDVVEGILTAGLAASDAPDVNPNGERSV